VEERIAMRSAGHVNAEMRWVYANIDKRLARGIAEKLNKLHAEREKAGREEAPDGTGFVSYVARVRARANEKGLRSKSRNPFTFLSGR
jgi:hypothetical protein